MKIFFITLKEFDTLIDRMTLALDSANNLGQFTTSVKILFQMNEELPDDLQLSFEEIDDPNEKELYSYGCESKILQLLKLPDGTVKVLIEATSSLIKSS